MSVSDFEALNDHFQTWNTCPDCGSRWRDDVPTPGLLHRTQLCDHCADVQLRQTLLQALREVAGDHIAILPGDQIPTCAFCAADEGADHEAECTMNVVLAAIDAAEGREPRACYVVGHRSAVQS